MSIDIFSGTTLHNQQYRFLIKDLENKYTSIIISSNKKLESRHKESKNRKYKQIKGDERNEVKEKLKAQSIRDIYYERIKERNKEM